MTRDELIENYKALCKHTGINPADMSVFAGGSLLMHKLRNSTDDIDATVTEETYLKIKRALKPWLYYEDHEHPSEVLVLSIGPFDIHLEQTITDKIVMVEGVACQSLEDVLALKLRLNREKDQEDIRKIKAVLAKQKQG